LPEAALIATYGTAKTPEKTLLAGAVTKDLLMGATAILVVVWLGLGSGTSYQIAFTSPTLCEAARKEVLDDAGRLRASSGAAQTVTSAVCLSTSGINR
jgi:hypothetical protein